MHEPLLGVLVLAAVTVGSLHTIAPDHWVPFAALARAQGWSAWRTAGVTALCGFGHVTVSALLGLLAFAFGLEMLEMFGRRMEAIAGVLLIAFGMAYGIAGLRRALAQRLRDVHAHGHGHVHTHLGGAHAHSHHHSHTHADIEKISVWTLFALFAADPCVAVIPILFAAAPLGALDTTLVVTAYELATIGTMVALVLPARAAAAAVRAPWLNRYSDATAGGVIAVIGVVVMALGL
jgi:nickel/cobalt transporter (NicO) family protein